MARYRRSRSRSPSTGRRRHRSRRHRHEKSARGGDSSHRGGGGGKRREIQQLPHVPSGFLCHLCGQNHWTVTCARLRADISAYPFMDCEKGCWKCGQRGHAAAVCTVKKYRCKGCGGMHDTKDCEYDHAPEEWYEFFDARTRHVFYTNSDESEVQWNPPTHKLDTVLWYCAACQVMIPSKYNQCLKCHAERPVSVEVESSSSDDEEDDARSNN